MRKAQVFYNYLTVYDDKVFTRKKGAEWELCLLNAYKDVFHNLWEQMDSAAPITFQISYSMLDEVVTDAIIGMRKIVDSEHNEVKEPNAFKVAAYLAYWWLRHKPVYLHTSNTFRLDDALISPDIYGALNEEERVRATEILRWKLKHINELVAVQFVCTFIFDFENVVCGCLSERHVKSKEKERFAFESFDEMRHELINKLTYYFAYRALAPKVIEHILEAYTFHPAWGLTGNLWSGDVHDE
ncbi:MAG: hypothetical protein IJ646_12185 [Clostridia bacterium]|nr:hypothetical protein [Clostridia bacterium]